MKIEVHNHKEVENMHISIHIGKDKFKTKQSTSMPKYVRKAKLSYAHILQNQKKSNFMSPIVHENVVHKQSPLDRIPKQKESRGSIDAFTCTNIRHLLFFLFRKKKNYECTHNFCFY